MLDGYIKPGANGAAPSPRILANVKAMVRAKQMPEELAPVIASRVTTLKAAEDLAPALEKAWETAGFLRASLDDFSAAVEAALEEMADGVEPEMAMQGLITNVAQRTAARKAEGSIQFKPGIGRDWNAPEAKRERLVDAMLARIDRTHTPTMGREFAGRSLSEIAMMASHDRQRLNPFDRQGALRASMAHSTSDFPLILENALHKMIAKRMVQRTPDILRAASKRTNPDFLPSKTLTLSQMKAVREIKEGGEIPHSTFEEKGEANPKLRDIAGAINVTHRMIANDDAGFLDDVTRKMAETFVGVQRAILLEPLLANAGLGQNMADGNTLFHADHGNLAASGAVLDVASLSVARTAMRKQKGLAGEVLALEPWALVVPAELETQAQKVLKELNATKVSDVNPFAGQLELIVEPGLTSATAWYLIANPSTYEGLVWATLEGMDSPRVESRQAWETLGLEFRTWWHLDAAFTEHATWYRNPGA